ncbi:hypothetical protein EDC14_102869 [Hydrogenispora ethanolica]|uniref:Porin n=1 Tax=Hydrogenispora ethanolica TaxID=1082276 RepID=A0A4R1R9R2_HYDET|nr:hypothetical protein [Hydrogenispora ethanolica]TCL62112.1 hypothetical protein EDC14_102869 [Hydrogenispora ethanolica]
MRKLMTLLLISGSLAFICSPAWGQAAPKAQLSVDQRIAELNNRFSSLEASWGRFQLGGNFSLEADGLLEDHYSTIGPFQFEQKLGLYLNAGIDRNLSFALNLSHEGNWGDYTTAPLNAPFLLDEAFIKMEYPRSLNYLGRFRFSFGPLGLITDFVNNPAEGLALQHTFKDYHAIGLYSRMLTQIDGDSKELSTQDYFAFRLGWSGQATIVGLNLVPRGLAAEKAFSVDVSSTLPAGKIAAEVGWYSFDSPRYPDYHTDWTPAALVSFGRELPNHDFFQVKAGYIAQYFTPSATSLNHSSTDLREWFTANTRGLELYLQNRLGNDFYLENRLMISKPVNDVAQDGTSYRWRGNINKNFSPLSQLQFGVELNQNRNLNNTYLFTRWNLQF